MKSAFPVALALEGVALSSHTVATAHGKQRRTVDLHPTPENIPEVTDPRFILHEGPKSAFMDEASYEKITIGVAEGEFHEMFGYVAGLALPGDGTVAVLDSENREVRVFDHGGVLLTTFGGSGEGPGEFRDRPSRVSVAEQGMAVFVLEASGKSVEVFGRQDDSTLIPRVNFQTDLHSHNGCAMGGHYWVYGSNFGSESVLHKFTFDGERVASFLENYKSPRRLTTFVLSRVGVMACSEAHGIVALNRANTPVVSGYKANGEMAWQVKFADFDPIKTAETDEPAFRRAPEAPGQSHLRSIFTDPAGDFYVHYVTLEDPGLERRPDYGPLFKIDARTGKGTYLGIARGVRGIDSGYVFTVTNDPFPQVVIHKPRARAN